VRPVVSKAEVFTKLFEKFLVAVWQLLIEKRSIYKTVWKIPSSSVAITDRKEKYLQNCLKNS